MSLFKQGTGNWMQYRLLPDFIEINLHQSGRAGRDVPYPEAMRQVSSAVLEGIKWAQQTGKKRVIFTHGRSPSGRWKTTARDQVRRVMRSRHATPFIIRNECIQHDFVFVAAIKPLSSG